MLSAGANDVTPGEFVVDPPTLINLGFEWFIQGDYAGPGHNAALETRRFASLADYSKATGEDQHSTLVDYDIFVNVRQLNAQDMKTVQKVYKAEEFDFNLKPNAAAVDRGVALPNVTDAFAGKAPDLGALERGQAPPHYGPRQ